MPRDDPPSDPTTTDPRRPPAPGEAASQREAASHRNGRPPDAGPAAPEPGRSSPPDPEAAASNKASGRASDGSPYAPPGADAPSDAADAPGRPTDGLEDVKPTGDAPDEPAPRERTGFDPLAPYRGAFKRFFTVYRHVLGLLLGGILAYVRALPPGERGGFNHLPARFAAFCARPVVKRSLRDLPFARQLRRRLEILGPTFIKLGQIMALRKDLLPSTITSELSSLMDRLPEVPFSQVKYILERDLGRPLHELFRRVRKEPLGSASIAQAHLAETLGGEKVVFKVIKPGIREVITSDLKLLEAVGVLLQWVLPRYQPQQIIEEFSDYTEKELDYTFEADNAEIFSANFADTPGIVFPDIYHDLSTGDVLTMEFLRGPKPGSDEALALDEATRERVIDLGAEAIIRMLYQDGFFHADLHAGNLVILPDTGDEEAHVKVGFIDLGMVGRFGPKTRRSLLYYFYALVRGDVERATRYLLGMARLGEGADPQGFRRAVGDLVRRFRMQGSRSELSVAQLILESLSLGGKYRIFFPVEMTLMVKALITYEGVGRTMEPELDITAVSRRHVEHIFHRRFDPRKVSQELMSGAPELVDLAVDLPQLLAEGAGFVKERLNRPPPSRAPLEGLRSGILAGAFVVGGSIAAVGGGPWFLWGPLFAAGLLLAVFGSS